MYVCVYVCVCTCIPEIAPIGSSNSLCIDASATSLVFLSLYENVIFSLIKGIDKQHPYE